jgi:MFS family permease
MRTELRSLRSDPLVVGAAAVVLVAALCENTVNLLAPLGLDENGLSAGSIGLVLSLAAGLFIVAGLVATRLASSVVSLRVAGIGCLALTAALVPLVVGDSTPAIVAGVVLRMGALGLLWTIAFPLGALGSERTGVGQGTVNGVLMLAVGLGNTVGPLVGGALAGAPGDGLAYALLACTAVTFGGLLLALDRRHESGSQLSVLAAANGDAAARQSLE